MGEIIGPFLAFAQAGSAAAAPAAGAGAAAAPGVAASSIIPGVGVAAPVGGAAGAPGIGSLLAKTAVATGASGLASKALAGKQPGSASLTLPQAPASPSGAAARAASEEERRRRARGRASTVLSSPLSRPLGAANIGRAGANAPGTLLG